MDRSDGLEGVIVDVFEFVRHAVGGAVHVLDSVHLDRQVALCGRTGRPHVDGAVHASQFEHDDVCHLCWLTLPNDLRSRLYRHLLGVTS